MLHLDRALWYSGWDGELMAELIPATYGWFVVVLGQGLFATTDQCYASAGVLPLLTDAGFKLERAVWSSRASCTYGSNPFLSKAPLHHCLKLASLAAPSLPVNHEDYPLRYFSQRRQQASRGTFLCFVITQDQQFVQWGKNRYPDRYLSQLQTQSPHSLILLGSLKYDGQDKEIESKFSHYRKQGKWFYYAPELAHYLRQMLTSPIKASQII